MIRSIFTLAAAMSSVCAAVMGLWVRSYTNPFSWSWNVNYDDHRDDADPTWIEWDLCLAHGGVDLFRHR
ncbi:MAG TPA: hypothetical protein VK797_05410, partial [Tepidisphaeraceae bacterium]|nr:hypothetical protein [Tepidisphaeraceae bacterium]